MSENERRPIPGFEGFYEVTRDGRIWSVRRARVASNRTITIGGRWLKSLPHSAGYLCVVLHRDTQSVRMLVHRAVALAWLPTPTPERTEVNHKDGMKTHCHVDNLEWCTSSENKQHAHRMGLLRMNTPARAIAMRRVGKSKRKLSDEGLADARQLLGDGLPQAAIAKRLGVCQETISRIHRGETYLPTTGATTHV